MHVERVDAEIVDCQVQRLEDLLEREVLVVAKDDNVLVDRCEKQASKFRAVPRRNA